MHRWSCYLWSQQNSQAYFWKHFWNLLRICILWEIWFWSLCLFTNRFCDKRLKVPQITHQNKSLQTLEISRFQDFSRNFQEQGGILWFVTGRLFRIRNQNQTTSRKFFRHFESVTATKGKHSDISSRSHVCHWECWSCLLSYYVLTQIVFGLSRC